MRDRLLHRVFATGQNGGRPILWAAFRIEQEAADYVAQLRRLNPTWIINYETPYHRIDGRFVWPPVGRTA